MSKAIEQAWKLLSSRLSDAPEGLDLAELQALTETWVPVPSRRTLQRWLKTWSDTGRLVTLGATHNRRYLLMARSVPATVETAELESTSPIPLSTSASALRRDIRRPLALRQPIAYQRAFLDAYQPNVSAYLSPQVRDHLQRIGSTATGERPAGTYARAVYNRLLVDLSWASSRLEGNTYTRLDTEALICFGKVAVGKRAQETQMILNHKGAIEMLIEDAAEIGFNPYTLQNLHAILSDNLLPDPAAGGRLRQIQAQISGTVFHPLAVPQQIEDLFRLLLQKADAIRSPFEQAFFAMVHLPYLQPFEEVNKWVSRLAANIPLIRHNLCPLSFLDVPEDLYIDGLLAVYERQRVELLAEVFVWAYERSCHQYVGTRQTLAEPDPFRLRYRSEILETVGRLVREGGAFAAEQLALLAEAVPESDRDAFVAMVKTDLAGLHEGNIARYRLRPSEYRAWLAAQPGGKPSF